MSVTFNTGSLTVDMTAIDLADFGTGTVTASSSTEIDVTGAGGVLLYKLIGTGFTTFDTNGFPTDGTVTEFDFGHSTGQAASFTGLSMSATTFMNYVSDNDITGFETTALSGNDHLIGYHGNDVLVGEAGNDNFNLSKGGNDTAQGGAGNDYFELGAALTAADSIDGGTGSDKVALNGDYSGGVTFGAATVTNVEAIVLAAGHNYVLVGNDGNVASGATMTINGEGLGAGNFVNFDGSAETDGAYHLEGGAGNDILTGGAQADTFILNKGGNDTVQGGAGDDYIALGASFTAADTIDGGAGSDRIVLDGNYAAGVTLGATTLTSVEGIVADAGHSYKLVMNDANVANNAELSVNATALAAANSLYFDGSAETDGYFHVTAGAGNDTLIGGAGDDTLVGGTGTNTIDISQGGEDTVSSIGGNAVFLVGAAFDSGDSITGHADNDTVVFNGAYAPFTVLGTQVKGITNYTFDAGHSYNVDFNFTNYPNVYVYVKSFDASALGASDSLTFQSETSDAHVYYNLSGVTVTGGEGNDTISIVNMVDSTADVSLGGNDTVTVGGTDVAYFGDTFNGNDHVTYDITNDQYGYAGLAGDYSAGLTLTGAMFTNVAYLELASNFTYDFMLASSLTVAAAFNTTGWVYGTAESGNLTVDATASSANVLLDYSGTTIGVTGGSGAVDGDVQVSASGTVTGGSANDSIVWVNFNSSDAFDGGTGNDMLTIEYGHGNVFSLTLTNAMVQNTDFIIDDDGDLTLASNLIGTGQSIGFTVLTGSVDASAVTAGSITATIADGSSVIGSANADSFTNGGISSAVTDSYTGGGGGDTINVGTGSDKAVLIYNGASDSTGVNFDTVIGFSTSADKFDTTATITGINPTVTSGALNTASFDTDMASAIGATQLHAHDAVLFTPTSGNYDGDTFLIVDLNGTAGYQAGQDLVIEMNNMSGTLTTSNFI
ncbi:MAG TPA: calcium-binding protein [Rhizomicrobium sp.]|jgi:Ca2+-binding RTX toxin-like protein